MPEVRSTKPNHPSNDRLISILAQQNGLLGKYVRNYPGKDIDSPFDWIDVWFLERSNWFFQNIEESSPLKKWSIKELRDLFSIEATLNVQNPYYVYSIHPNNFRGFRKLDHPISLSSKLIVIDGSNSSGKTSLTEAFEWLITGKLLRRSLLGNPRELENCICNQLRPNGEETWVEVELISEDGKKLTLKRVLVEDYGCTQASVPESVVYKDGKELSNDEETNLIEEIFAGEHPVLMQHSLRLFISSTPTERRDYFERLLQLDELTYLIEKSVVGDTRLEDFSASTGGVAIKKWDNFISSVKNRDSKKILRRVQKSSIDDLEPALETALSDVAKLEYQQVKEGLSIEQISEALQKAQLVKRQQKFPLLETLRPTKVIDEQLQITFSQKDLQDEIDLVVDAHKDFSQASKAAELIGEAQVAIAEAFQTLNSIGLIVAPDEVQICPLCNYDQIFTLTPERIQEIEKWQPTQVALNTASSALDKVITSLKSRITFILNNRKSLLPNLPNEEVWSKALEDADNKVAGDANALHAHVDGIKELLLEFDQTCERILGLSGLEQLQTINIDDVKQDCLTLIEKMDQVLDNAKTYGNLFEELDKAVGASVSEDPAYNLRQQWLELEEDLDDVAAEIRWEQAKNKAQTELKNLREIIKSSREVYLERRRLDFSESIGSIWEKLRNDRYSAFSKLRIPPPRGKGFPVEIEVKALLDDGERQVEVDALRVFSDSQVNVLGIAAFVTRAKLIGHKSLIIDDPVQSMDEDHFLTFAETLLPYLLTEGFQVVVLTHNDKFARDISHKFAENEDYVTMSIRHSRKKGCYLQEGNRRVTERLKKAEKYAEDGEFELAWSAIRKAIERLYLVTYIKYGPSNFNPHSWQDQTSEYMWGDEKNPRVGEIIENKIPKIGVRLNQILNMTAAGAHDKSPRGYTDLVNAIKDLRSLPQKLRVGG
ncbi:MAG: AAA family ATPase [Candidatus Bathyarchaeia archaeon]